jgi:hypothetical protein
MAKKNDAPAVNVDTENIGKNLLYAMLKDKETIGTHFNFVKINPVIIPSGSLKMDNYLKIKSGSVIRMGGPAEVGKTSEAILLASNYMKVLPKSKTIYVNAESKFGEEIQTRTGQKFVTDPNDWNYGTIFILQTNCFDTICDVVEAQYKAAVETGEHLCVIIDSVDMLRLKSSFEQNISAGKKPAGVNYLTKELFRRLSHFITHYNGMMIMITQYAATFTMDKYEKEAPNLMDGNQTHALNHQASYALYYQPRAKSHYILESEKEKADPVKNKILGVNAKVDIRKSCSDETGYMLEIPIKKGRVGNAIWVEKELFDALFLLGLANKKGSWIELSEILTQWIEEANKPIDIENKKIEKENEGKLDSEKKSLVPRLEIKIKHQGLEQFSDYFEANQKILNIVLEKIRTIYA